MSNLPSFCLVFLAFSMLLLGCTARTHQAIGCWQGNDSMTMTIKADGSAIRQYQGNIASGTWTEYNDTLIEFTRPPSGGPQLFGVVSITSGIVYHPEFDTIEIMESGKTLNRTKC